MVLESSFVAVVSIFAAFGLFCFVKLWFSSFGDGIYSAIFLEKGDDVEILDMKIREVGRSGLYRHGEVLILVPENRNYDQNIKEYIESKRLKVIYYRE